MSQLSLSEWRRTALPMSVLLEVLPPIMLDSVQKNIVVPVLPYRLEALHYANISALTSWLLFSYSVGILLCWYPF